MGDDQLAFAVLGAFHQDFHLVTHLQVGVVTEFGGGDDTFALGADVHHDLTLVDGGHDTFHDLVLGDLGEGLLVLGQGLFLGALVSTVVFKCIPVEILGGDGGIQDGLLGFFLDRSLVLELFCHVFQFFRHN